MVLKILLIRGSLVRAQEGEHSNKVGLQTIQVCNPFFICKISTRFLHEFSYLMEYLLVNKSNEIKEKDCDPNRKSSKVTN